MADPLKGLTARSARHYARTGRPLVTLTYAQSLDGSIAVRRDRPLALSGDASRLLTHQLRAAHTAILVGIGTLLSDDPRLTARLAGGPDPQPVIVDSQLRFPLSARLLHNPDLKPWIVTSRTADPRCKTALEAAGARVESVPSLPGGWLDLAAVVALLGQEGVNSLMVEGGARIITSFLTAQLADWVLITIAPVYVGGVRAVEAAGDRSNSFPRLEHVHSQQLGQDVILWGDVPGGAR
jgi:GTP cyclohydrolase II